MSSTFNQSFMFLISTCTYSELIIWRGLAVALFAILLALMDHNRLHLDICEAVIENDIASTHFISAQPQQQQQNEQQQLADDDAKDNDLSALITVNKQKQKHKKMVIKSNKNRKNRKKSSYTIQTKADICKYYDEHGGSYNDIARADDFIHLNLTKGVVQGIIRNKSKWLQLVAEGKGHLKKAHKGKSVK